MSNLDLPETKDIPGFPDYAITKDGKVWSKPRKTSDGRSLQGRWLKSRLSSSGYKNICLSFNSQKYVFSIHRLLLETYIGPCPDGMEACHNNGNRLDNHLGNLRWDTRSNNRLDAVRHGTHVDNQGEKCGTSKLTEQNVRIIIYMYRTGLFLQKELAKMYKVTRTTITHIINKKRWSHIWVN